MTKEEIKPLKYMTHRPLNNKLPQTSEMAKLQASKDFMRSCVKFTRYILPDFLEDKFEGKHLN